MESPLLAQSGHPDLVNQCPLLGVKRTSRRLTALLLTHSGHAPLRIAAVQPLPGPVADVAPNTDLQNNRVSRADSALGELANEVHQNTTNCCARINAGGNEFCSASKRNNSLTG
jgi:hypothetical protein